MSSRPHQPLRPAGGPTGNGTSRALRRYLPEHQFQPGQSGNPGGKPKRARSVAKAIRELLHNDPAQLIVLLLDIAEDGNARDSDRISAIRELLDRGYGKAPEHAPIQDGDPLELGPLEQAISEIIYRRRDTVVDVPAPAELQAGDQAPDTLAVDPVDHLIEIGESDPESGS